MERFEYVVVYWILITEMQSIGAERSAERRSGAALRDLERSRSAAHQIESERYLERRSESGRSATQSAALRLALRDV